MKKIIANNYKIYHIDCLILMQKMIAKKQVCDSIISDCPYHLTSIVKRFSGKTAKAIKPSKDGSFTRLSKGFLQQVWDGGEIAFDPETWKLAYQILKPGGYIVLFAASRNVHRMAMAVETAGFLVKDQLMFGHDANDAMYNWIQSLSAEQVNGLLNIIDHQSMLGQYLYAFGTGFNKTASVDTHFDKHFKLKRGPDNLPVSDEAKQYEGFNVGLKPAYEPILVAQKPISEKSVALNLLKHGTGAMNIRDNRVPYVSEADKRESVDKQISNSSITIGNNKTNKVYSKITNIPYKEPTGRYPAHFLHDGSTIVNQMFDQFGITKSTKGKRGTMVSNGSAGLTKTSKALDTTTNTERGFDDKGNVGRFFYCAKSSKKDKNYGLPAGQTNPHPTVKSIPLMSHLVSLFTPIGGTTFDPFMGSGSTGVAALKLGMKFVGCDMTEQYFDIAAKRIANADLEKLFIKPSSKIISFIDEPNNFSLKAYWSKR